MNAAGLPLIGVVPEDVEVMLCANRGQPLTARGRKGAGQACWNIAQRLDGLSVPIMGFTNGTFGAVEDNNTSLLASIGNLLAWIFYPIGWAGDMAWKATVATFSGLIAKEEVVMTFGTLYKFAGELSEAGDEIWALVKADFGAVTAYSFMIFNLLCAPCFAAMGAIKREMNNPRWTAFAIGYMCAFAYVISMIVYQIGGLFTGEATFNVFTVIAVLALAALIYLLVRPNKYKDDRLTSSSLSAK